MSTAVLTFTCSICGETSHEICVYCTKDTCMNHMCERCHRCSDCCKCGSPILRDQRDEPLLVGEPIFAPEPQVEATASDDEDLDDEDLDDEDLQDDESDDEDLEDDESDDEELEDDDELSDEELEEELQGAGV